MARIVELLWGPADRPTRGPKPALSTRRIAETAIAIADEEGLAAVAMQRVATELAFTKMALYRYFPGKAELVAVMIDTALGDPPADLVGGWRARLTEWAHRLWSRYERHPWLLQVTMGPRPLGPNELGWTEAAVAAIAGTGLTGREQLDAVFVVSGHIRNLAQQTLAQATHPSHSERQLGATIADLLTGRESHYPALTAAIADNTMPDNAMDNAMDFGLARILDGIEPLIADRTRESKQFKKSW
ncbi:TetR/AcrR family transcriptional regulator [Actinophytocola sediminis]